VGVGLGIDPLVMAIAMTLAVSGSYMLGDVSMQNIMRGGLWLNIISIVTIPVVLTTLVPLVFGVGL
jgi:solute carrier family 13 (sodium-dependent dicarboxylate transporter), member 2/3/5